MSFDLDIQKAVSLLNKKTTTIEAVCKLIFEPIEQYQTFRENESIQQFKQQHSQSSVTSRALKQFVAEISNNIEKDVREFVLHTFVDKSIDMVLDAMNQKQFKTKKGSTLLLSLLTDLKKVYNISN